MKVVNGQEGKKERSEEQVVKIEMLVRIELLQIQGINLLTDHY